VVLHPLPLPDHDPRRKRRLNGFTAVDGPPGTPTRDIAQALALAWGGLAVPGRAPQFRRLIETRLGPQAHTHLTRAALIQTGDIITEHRVVSTMVAYDWAPTLAAEDAILRPDLGDAHAQLALYEDDVNLPSIRVHLLGTPERLHDALLARPHLLPHERATLDTAGALRRFADLHRDLSKRIEPGHGVVVDTDDRTAAEITDTVLASVTTLKLVRTRAL
jgi:hypothetical protein